MTVTNLSAEVARSLLIRLELLPVDKILVVFLQRFKSEIPDDSEVGLMRCKTKHNQISVCSTEHMLRVGIVVRSSSLLSGRWHFSQCFELPLHSAYLMKSMILCSPSPGTLASERITLTFFQPASLFRRSCKVNCILKRVWF